VDPGRTRLPPAGRCPAMPVAWCKGNVFRKIRTKGNYGPRKELASAGRVMTRCTGVARRKGHGRKRQTKDDAGKGTHKG
jgi:hypothetical protein